MMQTVARKRRGRAWTTVNLPHTPAELVTAAASTKLKATTCAVQNPMD
jgi:hypothetical protein